MVIKDLLCFHHTPAFCYNLRALFTGRVLYFKIFTQNSMITPLKGVVSSQQLERMTFQQSAPHKANCHPSLVLLFATVRIVAWFSSILSMTQTYFCVSKWAYHILTYRVPRLVGEAYSWALIGWFIERSDARNSYRLRFISSENRVFLQLCRIVLTLDRSWSIKRVLQMNMPNHFSLYSSKSFFSLNTSLMENFAR